jgi:hypothetical protein
MRTDWETYPNDLVSELRWCARKSWGGVMRFSRDAHARLMEIHKTVVGVDAAIPQIARAEWNGSKWTSGLTAYVMREINLGLERGGAREGGPLWLAANRAAARGVQRWKTRVGTYGWNRPFRPREIVPTIRLPFGAHYGRPLREVGPWAYVDELLLGAFEVEPPQGPLSVRPETCSYAECALTSRGWRARFVRAELGEK